MKLFTLSFLLWTTLAATQGIAGDHYLVKVKAEARADIFMNAVQKGAQVRSLNFANWHRLSHADRAELDRLRRDSQVLHVQPDYKISLREDYRATDPKIRAIAARQLALHGAQSRADNPAFPKFGDNPNQESDDPLFDKQWGMGDIGVEDAWHKNLGTEDVVVAVIDTGVDYTHEDLKGNIWTNRGETGIDENGKDMASNGIDDDENGYIDDVIGWDVVKNDNKPYDLAVDMFQLLIGGGNPGHGTHCAGNVAARGLNGIGIAGVAPNVKIMVLRFLGEKGQGTSSGAIEAVKYAVDNGARILSNSWGSEGEDSESDEENLALKEVIQYVEDHDSLFIAAAGNGHKGKGYDNDSDAKPAYPASYDHDTIISVAALDVEDKLGSFSNWGKKTVDLGAPGVKVFSTTVSGKYSDTVIDFLGMNVTWDGTSMATPHVAGAAALYLSEHPDASMREMKDALLSSATAISALDGKSTTGGKLNVKALLEWQGDDPIDEPTVDEPTIDEPTDGSVDSPSDENDSE